MPEKEVTVVVKGKDEASKVMASIGQKFRDVGRDMMDVGFKMTSTLTGPLLKIGKVAVTIAGDFEEQMNILGVAVGDAGGAMEDSLREAAIGIGADTQLIGIDAAQAADALTTFYKAGLTTADIFGGDDGLNQYIAEGTDLTGVFRQAVDLAAASDLDLAQASEAVAIGMKTFSEDTAIGTSFADVFVKTADAAVLEVSDLTDTLRIIGPVAAAMGIPITELSTAVAILSERGIVGSEAGTGLRSMLTNLQRPTKAVKEAMAELNVSLYDSEGRFKGMPRIIDEFGIALEVGEDSMHGLTEEMRNQYVIALAGTYGQTAMNTLLEEGTIGWDRMTGAIENAASAEEVGAARTKGFNAAMEQLQGAFETFMIKAGQPLIDEFLIPLIDKVGIAIDWLMTLDTSTLAIGIAFGVVLAAAGPVLMVLGFMATAIGVLISPIGLIVAGIVALGAAFVASQGGITSTMERLQELGYVLGDYLLPIVDWAKEAWGDITAAFQEGGLSAAIQAAFEAVGDLSEVVAPLKEVLTTAIGSAWDFVSGKAVEWAGKLRDAAVTAFDYLSENVPIWGEKIWEFVSEAWATLTEKAGEWGEVVRDTALNIWDYLSENVPEWGEKIWEFVGEAWDTLTEKAEEWGGKVKDAALNIWDYLSENVPIWGEKIWEFVGEAWDTLKEKAVEWGGKVKDAALGAFDYLQDNVETWTETVKEVTGSVFDTVRENAEPWGEKMVEAIGSAWDSLSTAVGGWITKLGPVLTDVVIGGIKSLYTKGPEFVTKMLKWLEKLEDKAIADEWGVKFGEVLGKIIKGAIAIIVGLAATIGGLLWAAIKGIFDFAIGKDKEEEQTSAFKVFGMQILDGLMRGLTGKENWQQGIADWWDAFTGEIVEEFNRQLEEIKQVGKDLVAGIADGIKSVPDILKNAVKNVVNSAINAAKSALGIRSPSTIFAEMGLQMMTGWAAGIDHGEAKVIEAVGEAVQEVIAVFSDMLTLAQSINSMGGMPELGDYFEQFEQLAIQAVDVIQHIQNLFSYDVIKKLQNTAKRLSVMFDAVVRDFSDIKELDLPDMEVWADDVYRVMTAVVDVIGTLQERFTYDGIKDAALWSDSIKKITGLVEPAIDMLATMATYEPLGNLQAQVKNMHARLLEVMPVLLDLAKEFELEGVQNAAAFYEAAGKIWGQVSSGIDVVKALVEYEPAENIDTQAMNLADRLWEVIKYLGGLSTFFELEGMQNAAKFFTAAGTIFGSVSSGIDIVKALVEYEPVGDIVTQAIDLGDAMKTVLGQLELIARGFDVEGTQTAALIFTAAGTIFDAAGGGIDLIKDLVEWEEVGDLTANSQDLAEALEDVIGELDDVADFFVDEGIPAAANFYTAAGSILDAAGGGIELILGLLDLPNLDAIPQRMILFGEALTSVITELKTISEDTSLYIPEAGQIILKSISDAVGMIKPAVDAMTELADYVAVANLPGQMAVLKGQLIIVIDVIEELAGEYEGGLTDTVAFAKSVEIITKALKTSAEALGEMIKLEDEDIPAAMANFGGQMADVITGLGTVTRAMQTAGLSNAGDFLEVSEEIRTAIIGGINLIMTMAEPGADVSLVLGALRTFGAAVTAGMASGVAALRSALDQMETALINMPPIGAAYDAGWRIGDAFVRGLDEALQGGGGAAEPSGGPSVPPPPGGRDSEGEPTSRSSGGNTFNVTIEGNVGASEIDSLQSALVMMSMGL